MQNRFAPFFLVPDDSYDTKPEKVIIRADKFFISTIGGSNRAEDHLLVNAACPEAANAFAKVFSKSRLALTRPLTVASYDALRVKHGGFQNFITLSPGMDQLDMVSAKNPVLLSFLFAQGFDKKEPVVVSEAVLNALEQAPRSRRPVYRQPLHETIKNNKGEGAVVRIKFGPGVGALGL